jgi:hypothetical protein
MQSLLRSVLTPYTSNKNTGNLYEIATALRLLRKMGLSDADLDEQAPFLDSIAVYNTKKTEPLRALFASIKTKPVGTGLVFDGHPIVRIVCVTQDDGAGRTGDFILSTATGTSLSLSVCEGKPTRKGEIKKCLANPTATRFGCTEEDIGSFKAIQEKAVVEYKAFMTDKYGASESAWPSRTKTTVSTEACSAVAKAVEARFGSLEPDQQTRIVNDLLRIEDGKKPADYLVLVHEKTLAPLFFRFETPSRVWAPTLRAKGIYLELYNGPTCVGSTQVKFNNGVYHKGKTSSLVSSWNATACLSDLFTMTKVPFPSL